MFWLRGLLLISPFAIGLGLTLLHREVGKLRLPVAEEIFTTSIQSPIGRLNPAAPGDGPAREIAELVFEPLLLRDEAGKLAPNLLASWEERALLTVLCASEEDAGEAEAELLARKFDGDPGGEAPQAGLVASERVGSVLTLAFAGASEDLESVVLSIIGPARLADTLLVEVRLKHSARDSMRSFLANANERRRIAMIDYDGDVVVMVFVRGDPEPLLRELELFYAANASLEPEVAVVAPRSHVVSRELVLAMRSGVRWHDGTEVSAKDLLFSHSLLVSEQAPSFYGSLRGGLHRGQGGHEDVREAFDYLDSLEEIDRLRVRAICREIPPSFLESWARLPLLPSHLLAGPDPEQNWATYLDRPVGCGPYRMVARRPDGGVELEAHSEWHRGTPAQERLVFRRMESLESKLLALRSARLESLVPDLRFADWARRNPESVITRKGVPRFQHLVVWNLHRPPFDRENVRLALATAVDLDALLADGAEEFRSRPHRYFDLSFSLEPLSLPGFAPSAAIASLASEGLLPDVPDSAPPSTGTPRFAFQLLFDEAIPFHRELASGLSETWRAAGVSAAPVPMRKAHLESKAIVAGDFDAVLIRREIPQGRDLRSAWGFSARQPRGREARESPHPEIDALIEALRLEPDERRALDHATALQSLLASAQPAMLLAETGRIWWFRAGGVEVAVPDPSERPDGGSGTLIEDLEDSAGRELESTRPWWSRRRPSLEDARPFRNGSEPAVEVSSEDAP